MTVCRTAAALMFSVLLVHVWSADEAKACKPNPDYLKLSLEQKISRVSEIFIGRVISVKNGTVIMEVEETLRGPHLDTKQLKQRNSMCVIKFKKGQKLFYAGDFAFGPTRVLDDGIPDDLAPIVEKLRKNIPLETPASSLLLPSAER